MKDNKNIIALDIDDCILPSNNNYFGRTDDNMEIFEINLIRLKMIIEKYDFKIFITSSWYIHLGLEKEGELELTSERNDYATLMGFSLMKKYIGKHIVGLSCGDRNSDISELIKQGNKVVILDDWDLQSHQDNNKDCLYVPMSGMIDGNVGFMIDKFIKTGERVKRRGDN